MLFRSDPFEQHVSLFFYLRREAESYRFQGKRTPSAMLDSFDGFMAHMEAHRDRIQTTFANTLFAHMPSRFVPLDPYQMFDNGFVHIGTTDVMTASLALLGKKLGKPELMAGAKNASPRDLDISPTLRQRHEMIFPEEHAFFRLIQALHADELRQTGYL